MGIKRKRKIAKIWIKFDAKKLLTFFFNREVILSFFMLLFCFFHFFNYIFVCVCVLCVCVAKRHVALLYTAALWSVFCWHTTRGYFSIQKASWQLTKASKTLTRHKCLRQPNIKITNHPFKCNLYALSALRAFHKRVRYFLLTERDLLHSKFVSPNHSRTIALISHASFNDCFDLSYGNKRHQLVRPRVLKLSGSWCIFSLYFLFLCNPLFLQPFLLFPFSSFSSSSHSLFLFSHLFSFILCPLLLPQSD